jgi:hypothetical protein
MQANNDKGTVYIFRECGTGNLLLETTDMSVISGVVPSHTIARTEKVIIKGVSYVVVAFEIDISGTVPAPDITGRPIQTEPTDRYGIRTLIYVKKSINPLRNFFLQIKVKG